MLKEALLFCAVLAVSYAALAIGPLEKKPEKFQNTEGCYIQEFDEMIPVGQAKPSKLNCMEYKCLNDSVGYESCGSANTGGPCKVVRDVTKPFPGCCPEIICPSSAE